MEGLSLWDYFKQCLTNNYANFEGRARRKEFWGFTLFIFLFSAGFDILDDLLFNTAYGLAGYPSSIFNITTLIPSLAVGARRLHDVGKSGWMQLLYFFIIIGWIWLLILFVTESHNETNKFGPNPKNPDLGNEVDNIGME